MLRMMQFMVSACNGDDDDDIGDCDVADEVMRILMVSMMNDVYFFKKPF